MSPRFLRHCRKVVITKHAIEEYRIRVDPYATIEEICSVLTQAVLEARFVRPHCLGGHRYAGRGLVFAGKRDGPAFVVTTVFGTVERYEWEMREHNAGIWKYVRLCGSKY